MSWSLAYRESGCAAESHRTFTELHGSIILTNPSWRPCGCDILLELEMKAKSCHVIRVGSNWRSLPFTGIHTVLQYVHMCRL